MKENVKISGWQDFQDTMSNLAIGAPGEVACLFRGEAKSDNTLESSLGRIVKPLVKPRQKRSDCRDKILQIENYLKEQFMSQAELHAHPAEISDKNDTLSWWAVMQHYGAPTRLLDWSISPYVALYFAVQKHFN